MAALIAPSLLSADFLHLAREAETVNRHGDLFHLDIMDGTFVPNISFGFPVVEAVARIARKPMEAHLMIVQPERYVERFAKAGTGLLSFHYEAVREGTPQLLAQIHACGMKAGIALNPDLPVETLFPYLPEADYVLVMSVFAGFGGQPFREETYGRIRTLKAAIEREGWSCAIEVDGGVGPDNAAALRRAGAEILVAGSSVFRAADPAAAIAAMRQIT